MIYIITSDILKAVKIGRWSSDLPSLRRRYITYYGHNLQIYYTHSDNDILYETEILFEARKYAIQKGSELHNLSNLQDIHQIVTKKVGKPVLYVKRNFSLIPLSGFCRRHVGNINRMIYSNIFLDELCFSGINDTSHTVSTADMKRLFEKYKHRYNEIVETSSVYSYRRAVVDVPSFKQFCGFVAVVFKKHPQSKCRFKVRNTKRIRIKGKQTCVSTYGFEVG